LADGVEPLARFGLHTHLRGADAQRSGELPLHAGNVRGELGALQPDRGIHVHNGVAGPLKELADVAKKQEARSVAPPGGSVGEKVADIAKRCRTEQRVANGVGEGVAVGVAHGAFLKRNPHPPQDEFSSWGEAVEVIPYSDAARIPNYEL